MNQILTLTLATLVAGCAATPSEIKQLSPEAQFVMRLPPAAAAACVANNAETTEGIVDGHVSTHVRASTTPGDVDLVMHVGGGYVLVATFAPAGEGSAATVWIRTLLISYIRQRFLKTFQGC